MSDYVPAGPVQDHIRLLIRQGVSPEAIGAAVRMHGSHIRRIARGGSRSVRADRADLILALGVEARAPRSLVPSGDTLRRLQDLQAVGVPRYRVFEIIGRAQFGMRSRLRLEHAEAVERFYVRYFHEVLRQATPEEQRETTRSEWATKRAAERARSA